MSANAGRREGSGLCRSEPFEGLRKSVAGLIPVVRIPGHGLQNHTLEAPGHSRIEPSRTHRGLSGGTENLGRVVAIEGPREGRDLVERDAERIQIAAPVRTITIAARLLRRHVLEGPDDPLGRRPAPGEKIADQTEVDQPGLAALIDDDVPGLDVPMHDALRVQVIEGARDLFHDFDRAIHPRRFGRARDESASSRCRGLLGQAS